MSKGSASATKAKFWKVTRDSFPIQGLRDRNGKVHLTRPQVRKYHPPHNARYTYHNDRQIMPGWYAPEDLVQWGIEGEEALKALLSQGWYSALKPDTNMSSANYRSVYLQADTAEEAKKKFRRIFKIRAYDTSKWGFRAELAPDDVTEEGPCEPMKKVVKKTKIEPWDE